MSAGHDDKKPRSLAAEAMRRLIRNRVAMVSFAFVSLLTLAGLLAPFWERYVTHFAPDEPHEDISNMPPGVRDISIAHPSYDGDKASFALIDFDGDGRIACTLRQELGAVPGFRELKSWSPALYDEALAGLKAADVDGAISGPLGILLGSLDCPELRLGAEIARKFFDRLHSDVWDRARENEDPVPGVRNRDGWVTWKEFPHDDLDLPEDLRGYGLAGPEAFRQLDVDRDNALSRAEIIQQTRYFRYAATGSEGGLAKNFERFVYAHDADGDLAISLAEYPGAPELHTFALGTDGSGRDQLTRLLYGARLSMMIGLLATLISLVIGVLYGATAGYVGGRIDNLMMRFVDVLFGLPYIFIVILFMVIIDDRNNVVLLFMALGLVQWLTMARVVRGQVLSLKNREFVEAARAIGVGSFSIITRHLIPNAIGPVVVYATLLVPQAILQEAFLSFLGLGVDMSWGNMIAEGAKPETMIASPWLIVFPGVALAVTLFALNFFGDGVRDALDPQLKGK